MPADPSRRLPPSTTFLTLALIVVCVSWVMRGQAIRIERQRERDQWEVERRLMLRMNEEQSRELEHLGLAIEKLRRERHHATTRPVP